MTVGHPCPRTGCAGVLEVWRGYDCHCRIAWPPCARCDDTHLGCPNCGWRSGDTFAAHEIVVWRRKCAMDTSELTVRKRLKEGQR